MPSLWSNTRPDCLSGAPGNKGRKGQQRVADEALAAEAAALAARLAQGPTAAYALLRKLARDSAHLGLADALAAERVAQREAGQTGDFKQGVVAFLQKRPPSFDGR